MKASRSTRCGAVLLFLLASGCTALREIPRNQYAVKSERKSFRVETVEGLRYDFDYASFRADSVTGYRRRDTEGMFDEFDSLDLPLERVQRVSVRRVDWYRTGLLGGSAIAVVVGAALTRNGPTDVPDDGGGRPGP